MNPKLQGTPRTADGFPKGARTPV